MRIKGQTPKRLTFKQDFKKRLHTVEDDASSVQVDLLNT